MGRQIKCRFAYLRPIVYFVLFQPVEIYNTNDTDRMKSYLKFHLICAHDLNE